LIPELQWERWLVSEALMVLAAKSWPNLRRIWSNQQKEGGSEDGEDEEEEERMTSGDRARAARRRERMKTVSVMWFVLS
jgi:hypothetical protein